MFIYTSIFPCLKVGIECYTSLSLFLLSSVVPVTLDKRVKGPKTPAAPYLTEFKKEVILGSKSKRLTNAERNQFYLNKELKEILIGLFLGLGLSKAILISI